MIQYTLYALLCPASGLSGLWSMEVPDILPNLAHKARIERFEKHRFELGAYKWLRIAKFASLIQHLS